MKFSELLGIAAVAGIGWYVWNAFVTAPVAVASTPAAGTTVVTTGDPVTGSFSSPDNFQIAADVNGAYKGTVSFNGGAVTLDVIPGNIGRTSGMVFNTAGQDVTGSYSAAQLSQLYSVFQAAAQNQSLPWSIGLSGYRSMRGARSVARPSINYRAAGTPMQMSSGYRRSS